MEGGSWWTLSGGRCVWSFWEFIVGGRFSVGVVGGRRRGPCRGSFLGVVAGGRCGGSVREVVVGVR